MAYAYWKSGMHKNEAVFTLSFRNHPFKGGYSIACGLEQAINFLNTFHFDESDITYLAELKGQDGKPLFEKEFLAYLKAIKFECDIDAIPEGTVVFPYEPLLRVLGPIIQAQILESILLNIINFQTLIATKAARVLMAAKGQAVLEFGLRRAQGFDGAIGASRAAYIGGCTATSNVLAGKIYDIPVQGTHAHSWVMAFDDELEAFRQYAKTLPGNCVFLIDTYDTLEGVNKAIEAGKWLRRNGHELLGIRIDSGDLAYLSIEIRKRLDENGFHQAKIIASNELDEHIIQTLKEQGAQISVWGVGTKLITGFDQPALEGVYKLTAVRSPGGEWKYKVKLSEQNIKVSNPGILQVRRYFNESENLADVIYDIKSDLSEGATLVDPLDMTRQKKIPRETSFIDLLIPVFRKGRCVYKSPSIHEIRDLTRKNLEHFHPGIRRLINPHHYPVGIEEGLFRLKTDLIMQVRGRIQHGSSSGSSPG